MDNGASPISAINREAVQKIEDSIPPIEKLFDLADTFKMLGDSTRVRILSALSISELCVYDLALVLNMGRTAVSHQLRLLRAARLVKSRRDGKMIYYSLDDDHVYDLFKLGFEHISEE